MRQPSPGVSTDHSARMPKGVHAVGDLLNPRVAWSTGRQKPVRIPCLKPFRFRGPMDPHSIGPPLDSGYAHAVEGRRLSGPEHAVKNSDLLKMLNSNKQCQTWLWGIHITIRRDANARISLWHADLLQLVDSDRHRSFNGFAAWQLSDIWMIRMPLTCRSRASDCALSGTARSHPPSAEGVSHGPCCAWLCATNPETV